MSGLRWRVAGSIVAGTGWLVFVLLFAAFWALPSLIQNIVIVVVSFLILAALLGVMWASWGMRLMR